MYDYFKNQISIEGTEKEQISNEGTVKEVIRGTEGTKSEYRELMIFENNGKKEYLFDAIGNESTYLGKFINKTVKIKGYRKMTYVMWQPSVEIEFFYVEEIEEIK